MPPSRFLSVPTSGGHVVGGGRMRPGSVPPAVIVALVVALAAGCTSGGDARPTPTGQTTAGPATSASPTSGAPQLQGPAVDLHIDGAAVKVDDVCVDGDDVVFTVDGGMPVRLLAGDPPRLQVVRDGVTMVASAQVDDSPGMTVYRTTVADDEGRMSVDVAVGVFSLDDVPGCQGR